jgi:hypothetical protein
LLRCRRQACNCRLRLAFVFLLRCMPSYARQQLHAKQAKKAVKQSNCFAKAAIRCSASAFLLRCTPSVARQQLHACLTSHGGKLRRR